MDAEGYLACLRVDLLFTVSAVLGHLREYIDLSLGTENVGQGHKVAGGISPWTPYFL